MKKFRHAFNGMYYAVLHESSMRTHGLMMGVAIIAGFYFEITPAQWVLQLVLFALVIGFEMINTRYHEAFSIYSLCFRQEGFTNSL